MFEIWANMWSPQKRHFCAKSIKNSRKQVKNGSFSAVFWSKWRDSNSRPPVPETGALPTALHLDNRENSHLGACSQGRIRWLLREPSSLTKKHIVPPQMRWSSQGVYDFYWILLWSVMWSTPLFDRFCVAVKLLKTQCFQGVWAFFKILDLKSVVCTRNWRATNCATPRNTRRMRKHTRSVNFYA